MSKKDLEEEHSRELQIEQAFKTFEQALSLQKAHLLREAFLLYKDLFKLDVISNHYYEEEDYVKGIQNGSSNSMADELSLLSPNVKTLRYLVFRNRAFLYLEILRKGPEMATLAYDPKASNQTLKETARELFYSVMDDLVICLVYQEGDEAVLATLHEIFDYLNIKRLARFALEYELSGTTESDDILGLLPINAKLHKLYERLLEQIYENSAVNNTDLVKGTDSTEKYAFLSMIKDDFDVQIEALTQLKSLLIKIRPKTSWKTVIDDINDSIRTTHDKDRLLGIPRQKLKDLNPYLFTENLIEKVHFEFPTDTVEEEEPFFHANDVVTIDGPGDENDLELKTESKLDSKPVEIIDEKPVEEETSKSAKVIQRSSKRVRGKGDSVDDIQVLEITEANFFATTTFVAKFNTLLEKAGLTEELRLKTMVRAYVLDTSDTAADRNKSDSPVYVKDFAEILSHWDVKMNQSLFAGDNDSGSNSADSEKLKLLDVFDSFGSRSVEAEKPQTEISVYETPERIADFLKDLEGKAHHFEHAQTLILRKLLGTEENVSLIAETSWDKGLFGNVKEWVTILEGDILNRFKMNRPNETERTSFLDDFIFIVGIYEILVDSYVAIKTHLNSTIAANAKKTAKSGKALIGNLTLELVRIGDKLDKWDEFIEDVFLQNSKNLIEDGFSHFVRLNWATIYKQKAQSGSWKEKKYVTYQLQELTNLVNQQQPDIWIPLPNYEHIDEISQESISYQLMTASVLLIFLKILYAGERNSGDAIQLIESILLEQEADPETPKTTSLSDLVEGEEAPSGTLIGPIKKFLDNYPIEMKISLWNILFLYYAESKQFERFQVAFESYLDFSMEFLNSAKYEDLKGKREATLMATLSSYSEYLGLLLKHLQDREWRLPNTDNKARLVRALKHILRFFELFHLFVLHEEAAVISLSRILVNARSAKAFEKLKDIFVQTVVIGLIYYRENTGEVSLGEIVSLSHEHLGYMAVCDSADGLFLRMGQDIFIEKGLSLDANLAQVISCRFHYKVTVDGVTPVDHGTSQTGVLDAASTTELAGFILPLCFKRNPLLHPPKADLKTLIDDLYEVVGEPNFEKNANLNRNNAFFDYFLDSTALTSRFFRDAFHGIVSVPIEPPSENAQVVRDGLYYLQAVLIFNLYKIRKKSMQSRAVELEHIILLLKYDLIFCSTRVESWFLLGQAFGYLVEDDLIWTSDKLTVIDRKVGTANLQRKALICYLMAVNSSVSHPNLSRALAGLLMSLLAKEMYLATLVPMDMIAFKVQHTPKFLKKSHGAAFVPVAARPQIKKTLCLKIMQQCLHVAIRLHPDDWLNHYYLLKVQKKLKKLPITVLESLQTADKLAKEGSGDPVVEPSYRTCSLLYKYVKNGDLEVDVALHFLQQNPMTRVEIEESAGPRDKASFTTVITDSLRKIISQDKKKWHHKPKYRLARILADDMGDVANAKEEMSSIVTLKATSKTLVSIWKPENERPGKHFYYTFEYVQFFIELLTREQNLIGLIQMLPKLRRSNSTMISLYSAWEGLCSAICKIIRSLLDVTHAFTETFMLTSAYQSFVANAKGLIEDVKTKGIPPQLEVHFCFLYAINDMKKFNNGFGPTSLIDDTIVAVFIRIYMFFDKGERPVTTEVTDLPNGKFKKLAKRDVFPFANDILKLFRREIENVLKDNADIYNTFVQAQRASQTAESQPEEALVVDSNLADSNPIPETSDKLAAAINGHSERPNQLAEFIARGVNVTKTAMANEVAALNGLNRSTEKPNVEVIETSQVELSLQNTNGANQNSGQDATETQTVDSGLPTDVQIVDSSLSKDARIIDVEHHGVQVIGSGPSEAPGVSGAPAAETQGEQQTLGTAISLPAEKRQLEEGETAESKRQKLDGDGA